MEVWRDIPNYEESYMASNYGRIYSKTRFIKQGNKRRLTKGRMLSQKKRKDGYLEVCLSKNNVQKSFTVHRLVMVTFFGDSELTVNHKDGNSKNNHISNLEYCTQKENMEHASATGLLKVGELSTSSKLKNKDVLDIRRLKKEGYKIKYIADKYDISISHAYDIISSRKWKHLK